MPSPQLYGLGWMPVADRVPPIELPPAYIPISISSKSTKRDRWPDVRMTAIGGRDEDLLAYLIRWNSMYPPMLTLWGHEGGVYRLTKSKLRSTIYDSSGPVWDAQLTFTREPYCC